MKRGLLSIFFITVLVFSASSLTHAQTTIIAEDRISLRIIPQIPKPNETIFIEVTSLQFDLDRASISWFINNKAFQNGTGLTKIQTKAGAAGENLTIRVVVTQNGRSYEQTSSVVTGSVDLIWQAHSYTPPFYKGKALFPYQGEATVVAMPNLVENGVRLDSKNLVYSWKVNGDVMKDESGYGKDSITVEGGVIIRPIEVSVTVTSASGKTVATTRTLVSYGNPEVIFYEDNPLYGPLYHQALGSSLILRNKEISIKAAPYFFSTFRPHSDSTVQYQWSINNSQTTQRTNSILLRHTGTEAGSSYISVRMSDPDHILQGATAGLTINFNSQ